MKRWRFFGCLLFAGIISATASNAEPIRDHWLPPRPQNLAELIASGTNDLVVVGTVTQATPVYRGFAETCGVTGYSWDHTLEIALRLEEVVYGSVTDTEIDSVVNITIIEDGDPSVLGKSVIVWAYRSCDDAWRLRGRYCVLTDGRVSEQASSQSGLRSAAMGVPIMTELTQARPHPMRAYSGAGSILLAQITTVHGWTEYGADYSITPLRWMTDSSATVPKVVWFPRLPACYPNMFTGDSLLVPIPITWVPGDTLKLADCPSALRVKQQMVPGFGLPLESFKQVGLMKIGPGYFVRPVQKGR